ncbi:hypothetical protein Y032_0025g1123 [Ancylostoma ceylanicum]|uniref:Uncharacterized protein n=1 Tax=Ancylostoma ceylanicum TaxID=53326 RepID=A0A016UVP5_9BILA|nr:hypothetical protein Y032_0025g1123 [Ancylostoma ceylanicum]
MDYAMAGGAGRRSWFAGQVLLGYAFINPSSSERVSYIKLDELNMIERGSDHKPIHGLMDRELVTNERIKRAQDDRPLTKGKLAMV